MNIEKYQEMRIDTASNVWLTRQIYTERILVRQTYTDVRRLTTGIRSEKCDVKAIPSLCERHWVYLQT